MSPLRIGVTCYPTTGGSGIIATEIGLGLLKRGHQVHFICAGVPARLQPSLDRGEPGLRFHHVELPESPLPNLGPYPLALASRLAEVAAAEALHLLHVHYAVPHATSAFLARQLLAERGQAAPRVICTLHGTDVTRLGSEPAILPVNRFSLLGCDGLTTPSRFLREAARQRLGLPPARDIAVIANFVDPDRFRPRPEGRQADPGRPWVLIHSSNFRPLKRVDDVVRIFAGVASQVPAELLLVGDGPELPNIERLVRELGLGNRVRFLGMQLDVAAALAESDVFLLPSDTEGFGLAALEALSCGVPVVASRVDAVPEVVSDGETGLLLPPGDTDGMTAAVLRLRQDPGLYRRMAQAARASVCARFSEDQRIAEYESYYHRILAAAPQAPVGGAAP